MATLQTYSSLTLVAMFGFKSCLIIREMFSSSYCNYIADTLTPIFPHHVHIPSINCSHPAANISIDSTVHPQLNFSHCSPAGATIPIIKKQADSGTVCSFWKRHVSLRIYRILSYGWLLCLRGSMVLLNASCVCVWRLFANERYEVKLFQSNGKFVQVQESENVRLWRNPQRFDNGAQPEKSIKQHSVTSGYDTIRFDIY